MGDKETGDADEPGGNFFNAPVPGPGPGPGDVFFWKTEPEGSGDPRVRGHHVAGRFQPRVARHRFRGAAGARSFTHAQYLSALVALHEVMRTRADGGDAEATSVLAELGLGTVSI